MRSWGCCRWLLPDLTAPDLNLGSQTTSGVVLRIIGGKELHQILVTDKESEADGREAVYPVHHLASLEPLSVRLELPFSFSMF